MGRFGYIEEVDLTLFPEERRPWYATWNAYHVAQRGMWRANSAKEFEKHTAEMLRTIRELQLGPWPRFLHLWGIVDMRWEFKIYNPGERPKGKTRWLWLLFEFFRGPWREPKHW